MSAGATVARAKWPSFAEPVLQNGVLEFRMAEVLVEFKDVVLQHGSDEYVARACGAPASHGLWQGWVEFISRDGRQVVRSPRETTQPNREDTVYWATGLTPVYLEGALLRALQGPLSSAPPAPAAAPVFDQPAPDFVPAATRPESVLNPFSVFQKGESLLRSQLQALSTWHLVNVIRAYSLSDARSETLNSMTQAALVDLIVRGVRSRTETPA
ncbi:MAG: hypothetical protein DMF86_01060 [Acidobacteria bacterium]|nr:MAG: hypothetical protein DMF86_01060 [Acidobacteriota bacterium]